MEQKADYPDWLDRTLIPDEAFASAYGAVSAPHRALFKTTIARLHALLGPQRDPEILSSRTLTQGADVAVVDSAASHAVVLFDARTSPVFVLAALLPAYLAGVPNVLAVHVGDTLPDAAMLTALELAGQEDVAAVDSQRCLNLLAQIGTAAGVRVCVTGRHDSSAVPVPEVSGLRLWRADVPERLGIWADPRAQVDEEVVRFCHPHLPLDLWGDAPRARGRDIREFFACPYGAFFVPDELLLDAVNAGGLALGPGEESVWVWPDLSVAFFRHSRFGISRSA